jgi:metal-dependent hydrolase (beta-lactamase superfamily II)
LKKVLIDGGSALDILFHNALTELGLKPEDLKPYDAPF